MALPYPSMNFVPLDILTAAEMNQIVANITSLSNGTGLENGSVGTNQIATGAVTNEKTNFTTSWTSPTLLNGFTVYGAPYAAPAYTKDVMGFVHLRGLVGNTNISAISPILQLPVGFRPSGVLSFGVANSGANGVARINVKSDGNIEPNSGTATGFIFLDGICFKAEQ